jgi:hypothetical protein
MVLKKTPLSKSPPKTIPTNKREKVMKDALTSVTLPLSLPLMVRLPPPCSLTA